jgi:uncharacterized LabA/DUF88 family protein
MQQLRGQRVGVFVDVQNMYYSAKNLYDAKVNFREVLREALKGRTLIRAIAYCIKADIGDEKNFFEALDKIGYEVKAKALQTFVGGAKKGDWDVGIAMDMIELGQKLDVVVLVSGDGDFVSLVQHMSKAMGCFVEVIAFGRTSSAKLRDASDLFTDMEKAKSRFLIKSHSRSSKERLAKEVMGK